MADPKPKKDTTVAPTNAASTDHQGKLSERQLDFVTVVHQHWLTEGTVFDAEVAKEKGVPEELFLKFVKSNAVKEALEQRGITWPPPIVTGKQP